MIESIQNIDQQLFLWLNSKHADALDPVMIFITGKFTWIPFYAFLVGFIIYAFKKKAIIILLGVALLVTLADQTASGFFKPTFKRLRPCHNTEIQALVHVPNGCGGQYGFVSSHAANSFAVALLLSLLFARNWITALVFTWAISVSYSRIYLGVHYPADIVVGGMIGMFWGFVVFKLINFVKNKINS